MEASYRLLHYTETEDCYLVKFAIDRTNPALSITELVIELDRQTPENQIVARAWQAASDELHRLMGAARLNPPATD